MEKTGERKQGGDQPGHEAETDSLQNDPGLISEILLESDVFSDPKLRYIKVDFKKKLY